jgi:hypothetical protein
MVVGSDITASNYAGMINNIRSGLGEESGVDFLLNTDRVVKWLEENPTKKTKKPLSANSIKTYLVAIKSTLRDTNDDKFADVMKVYDAKMLEYKKRLDAYEEKQELTEVERKKWVCWSCVLETRDKLKDSKDWKSYQDYVILCLYTMMPPERLDYAPMRVVKDLPTDTDGNYCVLGEMKATFVLNAYKTAKSKGQAIYDAPPELFTILKHWNTIHTSDWLLVKKTAPTQPLSSHELGQCIPRIFERLGQPCATLNILRHSFLTHMREGEMPLLEKKRLAERMGHSLVQAEKYLRISGR